MLVLDVHSSHKEDAFLTEMALHNISLTYIEPGMTGKTQVHDLVINKPFKNEVSRLYRQFRTNEVSAWKTTEHARYKQAKRDYKIEILTNPNAPIPLKARPAPLSKVTREQLMAFGCAAYTAVSDDLIVESVHRSITLGLGYTADDRTKFRHAFQSWETIPERCARESSTVARQKKKRGSPVLSKDSHPRQRDRNRPLNNSLQRSHLLH